MISVEKMAVRVAAKVAVPTAKATGPWRCRRGGGRRGNGGRSGRDLKARARGRSRLLGEHWGGGLEGRLSWECVGTVVLRSA